MLISRCLADELKMGEVTNQEGGADGGWWETGVILPRRNAETPHRVTSAVAAYLTFPLHYLTFLAFLRRRSDFLARFRPLQSV